MHFIYLCSPSLFFHLLAGAWPVRRLEGSAVAFGGPDSFYRLAGISTGWALLSFQCQTTMGAKSKEQKGRTAEQSCYYKTCVHRTPPVILRLSNLPKKFRKKKSLCWKKVTLQGKKKKHKKARYMLGHPQSLLRSLAKRVPRELGIPVAYLEYVLSEVLAGLGDRQQQ